eukprot:453510-Pyramimonas_sp.AAC.1
MTTGHPSRCSPAFALALWLAADASFLPTRLAPATERRHGARTGSPSTPLNTPCPRATRTTCPSDSQMADPTQRPSESPSRHLQWAPSPRRSASCPAS